MSTSIILKDSMSKSRGKVMEGVFAINKPPSISSAQVIRNLQHQFKPSSLFAPWLAAERSFRAEEDAQPRRKRRRNHRLQVKIGHGGTLDPMATGVLIMGVGKGTKQLQKFLECTKSYEATILFGAATDTYDALGKVLRRAEYTHITKEIVEWALEKFRGEIMQRPPIYSALRVQGKRLYEYAREGIEVPERIEERPVSVEKLEIMDWIEGKNHNYHLPEEEADQGAKDIAEKVLNPNEIEAIPVAARGCGMTDESAISNNKRRLSTEDSQSSGVVIKKRLAENEKKIPAAFMSGALQSLPCGFCATAQPLSQLPQSEDVCSPSQNASTPPEKGPPAVRIRMTVTSGFYVRSLSHDLGEAVGSLACMAELVRTRQGDFELGKNVMDYEDIEQGESVWGPKVEQLLNNWNFSDEETDRGKEGGK